MNVLILGGTSEASELIILLASYPYIKPILSLAGRTKNPVLPQVETRIGGFGGAEGLAAYIKENNIKAVVCATHPFARQMPFNAYEAAKITNTPVLFLLRPAWKPNEDDQWIEVASHQDAIKQYSLIHKDGPLNIFLTVGRMDLDSYKDSGPHFYLARTIDELTEKPLQNAFYINIRPPFTVEKELSLMREYEIDVVVTKNSGGEATKAKLIAARELGIPVIIIKRPYRPDCLHVTTAQEAVQWVMDRDNSVL